MLPLKGFYFIACDTNYQKISVLYNFANIDIDSHRIPLLLKKLLGMSYHIKVAKVEIFKNPHLNGTKFRSVIIINRVVGASDVKLKKTYSNNIHFTQV